MTTAAVIIAANPSRHTDRFRPTLQQGEGCMLSESVKTFLSAGARVYVVTGARADEVRGELEGMDVTYVHNPRYDREDMLYSVKLGVKEALKNSGRIFVTPLSIPPVAAADVARLMNTKDDKDHQNEYKRRQNAPKMNTKDDKTHTLPDILMPVREGIGGHPVLLSGKAAQELLSYHGEEGLRGWLHQQGQRVQRVDMDEKTALPFREKIQVRLVGEEAFFGPGPRQLLLGIQSRGSVAGACEAIGISYSKGRGIIRRMEQELGFELVERKQGGAGGGSAGLTVKGEIFLEIFARYERSVQDYAEGIFKDYFKELEEYHEADKN